MTDETLHQAPVGDGFISGESSQIYGAPLGLVANYEK